MVSGRSLHPTPGTPLQFTRGVPADVSGGDRGSYRLQVQSSGSCVSCSFTIAPTSAVFGAASGTGSVTVTAASGCPWTSVSSNPSWLTVTAGASGAGNGTVSYSLAANVGASRNGTLTIAGQTFTVTQAGPTLMVWPLAVDNRSLVSQDYAAFDHNPTVPNMHHAGLDIGATEGTNVLAAAAGEVITIQQNDVGCNAQIPGNCGDHGFGNTVIIRHLIDDQSLFTQYSHLSDVDEQLKNLCGPMDADTARRTCASPVQVHQGALIGFSGATCYGSSGVACGGQHLHFELKTFGTLVLGTNDSSTYNEWAYTVPHPNDRGYLDPLLSIHGATAFPGQARTTIDGAPILVGPGGADAHSYRAFNTAPLGQVYDTLAFAPSTATPACSGWYQVKRSDGLRIDDATGGQILDGWVCRDSVTLVNCPSTPGEGTSGPERTAFQTAHDAIGGRPALGCAQNAVQTNGFVSFSGTTSHYQTFQHGAIEYLVSGTYAGSAYAILQPFYTKWNALGLGPQHPLGYPVSVQSATATACARVHRTLRARSRSRCTSSRMGSR